MEKKGIKSDEIIDVASLFYEKSTLNLKNVTNFVVRLIEILYFTKK